MPRPRTARANPVRGLPLIRRLHVWLSVFVAPSLIFFAITGALQTFRIPDRAPPAALIQKLARVHKDDVFAAKPQRPRKPPTEARLAKSPPREAEPLKTTVLKVFFGLTSLAIAVTAMLGLWMALAHSREKRVLWALCLAGVLAPVLILAAL